MKPLLVVIPFTEKDRPQALDLLAWMGELGGCKGHNCLVVADRRQKPDDIQKVVDAAEPVFDEVYYCQNLKSLPNEAWPLGANLLHRTACEWVEKHKAGAFWWHEPDCIPLPVPGGWLEALQKEYETCDRPFMGTYVTWKNDGPLINGGAIYPEDTATRFKDFDYTSAVAWDVWMSPRIWKETHNSPLIQHFFGQHGMPPTFRVFHEKGEPKNTFTLEQIRRDAAVFHRNKDGTLIQVLREARKPKTPYPVVISSKEDFAPFLADVPLPKIEFKPAPLPTEKGFYHSGNLGDVIYGLYAVKKAGGGKMLLGPEFLRTALCEAPIDRTKFEMLRPLLEQQGYLTGVEFATAHPRRSSVFDLNRFRSAWNTAEVRQKTGIRSLCKMHCYVLGLHEQFDETETWLTVNGPIKTGRYVIHRSPRYRDDKFPWSLIYSHLRGQLLFVGLPQEHLEFEARYGRVAYWKPFDFLELAQLIAGAKGFIGNQSFPNALALGLGQKVIQESWPDSQDCLFNRPNFLTQPITPEKLHAWMAL